LAFCPERQPREQRTLERNYRTLEQSRQAELPERITALSLKTANLLEESHNMAFWPNFKMT